MQVWVVRSEQGPAHTGVTEFGFGGCDLNPQAAFLSCVICLCKNGRGIEPISVHVDNASFVAQPVDI